MRFSTLGKPERIWAIPAIHADIESLATLHDRLFSQLIPGDRIVYMGNCIGHGPSPVETLDEILAFRRSALAIPGMAPGDFIYLRGGQEEMWEKLQQLQFAPNPKDVLNWMLDNGMASMLEAYGLRPRDGLMAAIEGIMALTKWTARVRGAIRKHPGHDVFQCQLRRAAFTATDGTSPLLFVHAGVNPHRKLQDQGDFLWWGGQRFDELNTPFAPFKMIVRGYDPNRGGVKLNCITATLDSGCGFGGNLICALFSAHGEILDILES